MAVAVGMVMMTKASEKHGLTEAGTAYKIEEVCATYGLPTTDDASLEKLPRRLRQTRKLRARQSMLFCLKNRHKLYQEGCNLRFARLHHTVTR